MRKRISLPVILLFCGQCFCFQKWNCRGKASGTSRCPRIGRLHLLCGTHVEVWTEFMSEHTRVPLLHIPARTRMKASTSNCSGWLVSVP